MCFFLKNLNQLKDRKYFKGCLFFVSSLCVAIYPEINQSSEDLFLFDSHSQDCSGRVSSQGASILLRLSCIDTTVEYIFYMYAKAHVKNVSFVLNYMKFNM